MAADLEIVVAMDERGVIGRAGGLPWHLPEDLRRFRALTLGHPVVMGRRTHASIGRALPGRRNLVLTRAPDAAVAPGCEVHASLDGAIAACADAPRVMVIGGAALYATALPFVRRLHLTRVHAEVEGDVYFPAFSLDDWECVARAHHPADAAHAHAFTVHEYLRRGEPRLPGASAGLAHPGR